MKPRRTTRPGRPLGSSGVSPDARSASPLDAAGETPTDEMLPGLLAVDGLEELVFSQPTRLTDANLGIVAKLRKLKRLEIIGCPNLTDTALTAFQQARPKVKVVR